MCFKCRFWAFMAFLKWSNKASICKISATMFSSGFDPTPFQWLKKSTIFVWICFLQDIGHWMPINLRHQNVYQIRISKSHLHLATVTIQLWNLTTEPINSQSQLKTLNNPTHESRCRRCGLQTDVFRSIVKYRRKISTISLLLTFSQGLIKR